MTRKPLNLHRLRAFEAAARHESFKQAAAELSVTPVAVTRHIKGLEDELGVELFERLHRGVRLADRGQELLETLEPAFAAMRQGVEHARRRSGQGTLRIASEAAFAKCWLMPRLEEFHGLHPEIHVDLRPQDDNDELDAIIFYATKQRFGRNSHLLFREIVFPMCSPALLDKSEPIVRPSDLSRHSLLHDYDDDWWQRWFDSAGVRGVDARSNETFFSHDRLYEAVLGGCGVTIGDAMVYGDDLVEGRLVRLFTETMVGNQFILAERSSRRTQALDSFVAWIRAACDAHKGHMKRLIDL